MADHGSWSVLGEVRARGSVAVDVSDVAVRGRIFGCHGVALDQLAAAAVADDCDVC